MTNNHDSYSIGSVIRIIDNRTILVDLGKEGLSVGKNIQIYEIIETIKDLDGKDLDAFIYIKDTLRVIQVEKHYSVCKKMEIEEKNSTFALSPLLERTFAEYVPLKIDVNDLRPLNPKDPLVRVGDPIKLA